MIHDPPASYWFSRGSPPDELDAVVVGAGVVGLAAAYWATRQGARVVVLEGQRVAAGSTGRSTGFLVTGSLHPFTRLAARVGEERALELWELSRENRCLVTALVDAGLDCELVAEGSWRTCRSGDPLEAEWEASAARLVKEGYAVEWRSPSRVREASGSPHLGGALFAAGDGGLDPVSLCRGLAAAAGAEVRIGSRVRHLEAAGERVRLAWNGGHALARRVVVAVNAYAPPLVRALGEKVRAVRLQALATSPAARRLPGVWVVGPDRLCLRQLPDGSLLAAGVGRPAAPDTHGYLEHPTASGQAELEGALGELMPAFA
ncbi:MAG TPA: FAD-dependent oxidoreductase, partial [Thermoanaerobaculia bacterium]|nr:FAD-dependent oxidoreductase [Thermoanaerobaculia bacterium]